MFRRISSLLRLYWRLVILSVQEIFSLIFPHQIKPINEDVILITGGGRGIGRMIALELAKHRPKHIILCGRTEVSLVETSRAIQHLGVNCSYMLCDVSSKEEIYAMAREVKAKFGNVTILVNNAGVIQPNSILDASPEDIKHTFQTNTLAHIWAIKTFLPGMLEQDQGHIVSVNSMLGWAALNGAVDYCTSKFACTGLYESLKDELKDKNIVLTSVHPYHVDNSMFAGISIRFPNLFPTLREDYVAVRIVDGILRNRSTILIPRIMYAVAFFYSIAPVKVITSVMKFLHVHKATDQYKEFRRRNSSIR